MAGCDISNYEWDDYPVDELGIQDPYRELITKAVYKLVKGGKWFAFCTKAHNDQVDIMSITDSNGVKMGKLIGEVHYPDTEYRSAVYKYFMREYMCYYEVPIMKKSSKTDSARAGYDKSIITANVAVIAAWLNIPLKEAYDMYYGQLGEAFYDAGTDDFPYVKLYITKDGIRKVRKPREQLDLSKSGTRVIPIFALKMGIDMLSKAWEKSVVRIKYRKDGGDVRDLDVSTNIDKIREIYGETDYLHISMERMYDGDFLHCTTMPYGYLRVPEIGGSIYDNPLRSLSFARVISVEYDVEPNLLFTHVDMDNVIDSFVSYLGTSTKKSLRIAEGLTEFGVMPENEKVLIKSEFEMETWVTRKALLLGTTFIRSICLFMLANPVEFPGYDGRPKSVSESTSSGLEED